MDYPYIIVWGWIIYYGYGKVLTLRVSLNTQIYLNMKKSDPMYSKYITHLGNNYFNTIMLFAMCRLLLLM